MDKNEILNRDLEVRANVAENPNTPADVLTELAKDSNWHVRRYTAGNPNTPLEVLFELTKDSDFGVRRNAVGNPKFKEVFNR